MLYKKFPVRKRYEPQEREKTARLACTSEATATTLGPGHRAGTRQAARADVACWPRWQRRLSPAETRPGPRRSSPHLWPRGPPGCCHRGCPGRGATASNFTLGATVFPNTGIPMSATQQHSYCGEEGGGSLAVRPRAQPSEAVPGHSSGPIQCPTYLGAETPSQSRISCSADCHRPPGSCYRGREGDSPWPQRRWEQSRERPHAGHRCRIAGAGPRPEAHQNLPRSPCRSTPIQLGTGWPRAGRRPESQLAATSHLSPGLRLSPAPLHKRCPKEARPRDTARTGWRAAPGRQGASLPPRLGAASLSLKLHFWKKFAVWELRPH